MTALRSGLRAHPAWAGVLIALALAIRLLVPAGFMPGRSGGVPTLVLCSGQGPATAAMHGMGHRAPGMPADKPAADQPCAFAGLALSALPAVDASPIDDVLPFSFAEASPHRDEAPHGVARHLRPPLRGPPTAA